jgi:membrane protein
VQLPGLRSLRVVELGERSVRNFLADRMSTHAAALAYRGLFGLFPFVLLMIMLLGVLDLDGFFQGSLEQVGSEFSQGDSGVLASVVEEARKKAGGGLLSFGVAASFYSVYALARTLVEALNAAYGVGETRSRWKRLLLLVAFGPALAVATIIATGSMLVGSRLVGRIAGLVDLEVAVVVLWSWLRIPAALFLLTVVLSIVYRFAPAADQPYRHVTSGAAIAVIAWTVASLGFSFYLANFASYGATYGSIGAAIGLLFYLYLTASTVLLGGEVNAAIYRGLGDRDGGKEDKLRG